MDKVDKGNVKNYRPVSNLSFIYKLLERVVMARVNKHLDVRNLREPCQSAYRAGHSTKTALVKVYNDRLCTVDDSQYFLVVLLDLSSTFDTIDRDTTIQRLKNLFGINGDALAWMQSYFSGRTQRVVIGEWYINPICTLHWHNTRLGGWSRNFSGLHATNWNCGQEPLCQHAPLRR